MLLKFVDMKKFIAFIGAIVAGLLVFQSCEEHKINPDKLPEAAQTFISQFFPGTTVTFAEKEKDDGVVKYNVRLSDGTEIDFDKDGVWTSVDCEFSVLPDGILPAPISEYITANYPQAKAYKAEKFHTFVRIYEKRLLHINDVQANASSGCIGFSLPNLVRDARAAFQDRKNTYGH